MNTGNFGEEGMHELDEPVAIDVAPCRHGHVDLRVGDTVYALPEQVAREMAEQLLAAVNTLTGDDLVVVDFKGLVQGKEAEMLARLNRGAGSHTQEPVTKVYDVGTGVTQESSLVALRINGKSYVLDPGLARAISAALIEAEAEAEQGRKSR